MPGLVFLSVLGYNIVVIITEGRRVRMRYLRRLVWYIASRLFIVLLLTGILTITFYYAMNATNIYVVIKDGMARRAQVIMMDEPASSLEKYFTDTWLERDEQLQTALRGEGPYQNVSVKGFDHRISLKRVWCWPWENTATARVAERIPSIDGKAAGGVPAWPESTYSMILTREGGNWKIRNITAVE